MARPTKAGLAYFNIDTDRYQNTLIKRLKHKHSFAGIAIYDYLLCEIYRNKGFYIHWNDDTIFAVTDYYNVEENTITEIVNYCADLGLFNKAMLQQGILTSQAIQQRYMLICKNAKRKDAEKLIPQQMNLIEEETELVTEETPFTPEVTTQSNVNQSTEYEIIENEKKENKINTNPQQKIKVREFVYLSSLELNELELQYNDKDCNWMYDKLNDYKLAKGINYKSDYGAICSWVKRRLEEEKENPVKKESKILKTLKAGQAAVDYFLSQNRDNASQQNNFGMS